MCLAGSPNVRLLASFAVVGGPRFPVITASSEAPNYITMIGLKPERLANSKTEFRNLFTMAVSNMLGRTRFSLKAAIIVLTLVAVWMATVGYKARRVRELTVDVSKLGGMVLHQHQLTGGQPEKDKKPGIPQLILDVVGEEVFLNPEVLSFQGLPVTDSDLEFLADYPEIRLLDVSGTRITDKGLAHVSEISALQMLYLYQTAITDAGVKRLRNLNELVTLDIRNTNVTDESVAVLKKLKSLSFLSITGTQISWEGVEELSKALPNCRVTY